MDPHAILTASHPASAILAQPAIVVQRQLEMMNVFLGFEQANKYVILDGQGKHIGYLAEREDGGMGQAMKRQMFRTHRAFVTHVFDRQAQEVLRFYRPFSWIQSRINVYDALSSSESDNPALPAHQNSHALDATSPTNSNAVLNTLQLNSPNISSANHDTMHMIGEAQQQWAPLRRVYNLFLNRSPVEAGISSQPTHFEQFANVSAPLLSWDFPFQSDSNRVIGSVSRDFSGFARELFTDTGVYVLRFDAASSSTDGQPPKTAAHQQAYGMTLDERAVMLAAAVSIDFDFFSRHSHAGAGGFMPLWFPWWGGGAAAGEAGAAGAGAGAAGAEAAGAAGAGATGAAESGILGAGEAGALGRAGTSGAMGEAGAAGASSGWGSGGIAGAGTMAGYEAMQRGVYGSPGQTDSNTPGQQNSEWHDQFPDARRPPGAQEAQADQIAEQQPPQQQEDLWGWNDDQDPWRDGGGGDGDGGGGGGSWLDIFTDE